MIEFKKLGKTYKSRKGKPCVALKDLDLTLPDTGLIFIVGKSGSGKSTLLNLLGGLDTITEGDIIADGNSMASFKREDFDNYRSSYIGFVFQHYYLLEELTVADNVALAMNIVERDDPDEVRRLLREVGLEGYEDRYPRELSGGQQQRVAIARALAKNPSLILGDELTGNLDHKTSMDILTLLKEISKEKLVVIVSHNLDEADMFADRIIELHDGKLLSDKVRVKDEQKRFEITDDTVYLPYFRDLTSDEAEALDKKLKTGSITNIVQLDDGFEDFTDAITSDKRVELKKKKFSNKARRKYTKTYVTKNLVSKLVTIVIATLMLLCVTVFASLSPIGHEDVKYTADDAFLPVIKGGHDAVDGGLFATWYYTMTSEDYLAAQESIDGKIYEINNVALAPSSGSTNHVSSMQQTDLKHDLRYFYTRVTIGTLVCDLDFLINEYGENGELKVLAGEISTDTSKLIITDYVADSYLYFTSKKYKSYSDVLAGENKIGAIIDTGYKSRYAGIIERYNVTKDDQLDALYNELTGTKLYQEFQNEFVYTLGVTYSINPNFKEDYLDSFASTSFNINRISFVKDGQEYPKGKATSCGVAKNDYETVSSGYTTVNNGEIKLPFNTYNSIFGTNYTGQNYSEFEPHDVTIRLYDRPTGERTLLFEKTYRIVAISSSKLQMYDDDFYELRSHSVSTYGLYLENNDNLDETVSLLTDYEISPKTVSSAAIAGINKMLSIFIPLFKLIGAGLYVFIVVYLISYAVSGIKKSYFRIGVMRSMGAKNSDVGVIFISGVVLMGLCIVSLMLIFESWIVDLYNRILIESFSLVLDTYAHGLTVVNIAPMTPILNALLVLSITFISALICVLLLHKLKPIEIIRAKDNGGEVS